MDGHGSCGFIAANRQHLARRDAIGRRIDLVSHAVADFLTERRTVTHGEKPRMADRFGFRIRNNGEEC
jgi:hypothetical protein